MLLCPQCEKEYATGEACPLDGARLVDQAPRPDPLVGTVVGGKYRIEEKIARGGMGTVFRAKSQSGDVAIKVLHASLQEQPDAVKRFFREAKALRALQHPNIVRFFDAGQTDGGQLYLAMEFLHGQTLDELVRTQGPLPLELITTLMPQICNAVAAAHRAKVVHRDLTPQNILLAKRGHNEVVKLVDFGIAKHEDSHTLITNAGIVMGTPGFLAPEQITGESATDPRSDVYALGAVLYCMICGKRPFLGPSPQAILARQLSDPPEGFEAKKYGVTEAMRAVVMRAMERRPQDRFQSVEALLSAFADAVGGEEAITGANRFEETLSAYRRSHPSSASLDFGRPLATQKQLQTIVRRRALKRAALALVVVLAIAAAVVSSMKRSALPLQGAQGERAVRSTSGEVLRGITTERLYVGLSADFSGPSREAGRAFFVGIKAAFRAVNDDEGGVYGRQLQAIALDDGGDPLRAARNADELLDARNVFALVGALDTITASALLPEAIARDAVLFGPMTGASVLRDRPMPRHLFLYRPSDAEEAQALVRHLVLGAQQRPERIAVVAEEGESSADCVRGVLAALREHGHPDPSATVVAAAGSLEMVVKARPEAVVLCASSAVAARSVVALRGKGLRPVFAGTSLVSSALLEDGFAKLAPELLPGLICSQVVPPEGEETPFATRFRAYLSKYYPEAKHGAVTFEGYIVGRLFAMAAKLAGPEPTTQKLIAAIERMHDVQLGTRWPIRFASTEHQGSHAVWLTTWNERLEQVPLVGGAISD